MAPPDSCKWKWMVSVCKNLPTLHIFHINTNGYYDDFIFSTFLLNLIFSHYILLWWKTFFFRRILADVDACTHIFSTYTRSNIRSSSSYSACFSCLFNSVWKSPEMSHLNFHAKLILILCFIFAKLCQMRLFK